jgi:hypothetical protein
MKAKDCIVRLGLIARTRSIRAKLTVHLLRSILLGGLLFWGVNALARPRPPLPPFPEFVGPVLFHENFDWAYSAGLTSAELVVANYGTLRESWSGMALQRSGKVTPVAVPALDAAGRTNIICDANAAIRFWLNPYWSSQSLGGEGPGAEATLCQLVVAEPRGVAVIWTLAASADGSTLALAGHTAAGAQVLLRAEFAWASQSAHCVALNYGPKGTALFIDGRIAATGEGTWPVPTKGAALVCGGAWTGDGSAEADLDEIYVFGRPLTEAAVAFYYGAHEKQAALGPVSDAEWRAQRDFAAKRKAEREALAATSFQGGESLLSLQGYGTNDYGTNLWLEIGLGTNSGPLTLHNTTQGVRYQLLSRPDVAQPPWLIEQTLFGAVGTNTTTTVPFNERPILFFFAGADSDGDGLIDYFESLSGTNPQNTDTDFDGVSDYVEVIQGRNPNDPNGAVPDTTGLVNLKVYTPLH